MRLRRTASLLVEAARLRRELGRERCGHEWPMSTIAARIGAMQGRSFVKLISHKHECSRPAGHELDWHACDCGGMEPAR